MKSEDFQIDQITIAATHVNDMISFYNNVFDCNLSEATAHGQLLYSGRLGEIKLLICPNEIARVKAEQSRHQFEFLVRDIERISKDVKIFGGKIKEEIINTGKEKIASITDPDGNTMVVKQIN